MALAKVREAKYSSTISEFVSFKNNDDISYDSLSFKDKYDNIIYPVKNILDDYIDELMELTIDVTMSDNEYLKFRYKPKLLAEYLYDNAELDFIIMRINGICNMKEFDMKNIKLVRQDTLFDFLTSIYNANKNDIDVYNSNSNIY